MSAWTPIELIGTLHRLGLEFRGTVVADYPDSPGSPDPGTPLAFSFTHQGCPTLIEVPTPITLTDSIDLDTFTYSTDGGPHDCDYCPGLPHTVPPTLISSTLARVDPVNECSKCSDITSSMWLYLPFQQQNNTAGTETNSPHRYLCHECLNIPVDVSDNNSEAVQAAAVVLELEQNPLNRE